MKTRRNESREQETPTLKKIWFSGNFYCYEMKFPISEKFADFCVMLDNFLVAVEISYCRSEVIIFLFYQKLNAVRSENSANWGISCILQIFIKIVYLHNMNMNSETIICGKVYFLAIRHENSKFCQ